jgi:hypothetical protein
LVEPDDLLKAEVDDGDWQNGQGEAPDHGSQGALKLAYRVLAKFPDMAKNHRYQKFIGTVAVVSPVIVGLATFAIERRLHRGQSPERILEEITPDEIVSIAKEKRKRPAKKNGNGNTKNGRFLH